MPALTQQQAEELFEDGVELHLDAIHPWTHEEDRESYARASQSVWLCLRAFSPKDSFVLRFGEEESR